MDYDSGTPSYYWYKHESGSRKQKRILELEEHHRDMVAVNKPWRDSQWEEAANATKDLLHHWTRHDRQRPFFFCHIEAVETLISLNEIGGSARMEHATARDGHLISPTRISGPLPTAA